MHSSGAAPRGSNNKYNRVGLQGREDCKENALDKNDA
tara:strand:- start:30 stop:140 length:111 start_codon:yes stop_codon:yes gene_type:complete